MLIEWRSRRSTDSLRQTRFRGRRRFQTRKVVSYAILSDTDQDHAWQQLETLAREQGFCGRFTEEVITSLNEHYSEARAAQPRMPLLNDPCVSRCRSRHFERGHRRDGQGYAEPQVWSIEGMCPGGCGALCFFAKHKEHVCGPTSQQIGAMVDAVVSALSGSQPCRDPRGEIPPRVPGAALRSTSSLAAFP